MTRLVVEPAFSAGKPKKLLDQMRNIVRLEHYNRVLQATCLRQRSRSIDRHDFSLVRSAPSATITLCRRHACHYSLHAALKVMRGRIALQKSHDGGTKYNRLGRAANCGVPERRSTREQAQLQLHRVVRRFG